MGSHDLVWVQFNPTRHRWGIYDPKGTVNDESASFGLSNNWPWEIIRKPEKITFHSLTFPLQAKKEMPGQSTIGPVIGILASRHGTKFRGNSQNFRDIIRMGQSMGALTYVFVPDGWNDQKEIVEGFIYHPLLKKWVKGHFPLPNVVYNRIPYREHEEKKVNRLFLEKLQNHPEISLFNPSFFNKGELYEWLKKDFRIQKYLPETEQLNDFLTLKQMMENHEFVYLKPTEGKAGAGIMRLARSAEGYTLQKQSGQSTESYPFTSLRAVWEQLKPVVQGKNYLVQQGIRLPKVKGRPFDLRALLQKDASGAWRVTGLGARVAGKQSITTHVPRGGRIGSPFVLLKQRHGDNANLVIEIVKQATLELAEAIEANGVRPIGEMSMDVALDEEGAPWFLEANSKPMKFDEPTIRRKSLARLIEYSAYLAGFELQGGKEWKSSN